MATIQDFKGLQYARSSDPILQQAWRNNNYQYATSSHEIDHDMHPALIVQPSDDADIITAVKYAKSEGIAVTVKTGGHQYSGASSTSGENIVIDLKLTYKDLNNDLMIIDQSIEKSFVRVIRWV